MAEGEKLEGRLGPADRLRICVRCGRTLSPPLTGGVITCPDCEQTFELAPVERVRLETAGAHERPYRDLDVQQRLRELRKQADAYDPSNPYSCSQLPERHAQLKHLTTSSRLIEAFREILRRAERKRELDDSGRLALVWIARRLPQLASAQRAAPVIQTAMDHVMDHGHQHLLRCELAGVARRAGDRDAAAAWLALCDPAPAMLDLDSSLRLERASAAADQGDFARVRELVGDGEDDVPIAPALRNRVRALRAVALERTGSPERAELAVRALIAAVEDDPLRYFEGPLGVGRRIWARFDPIAATGMRDEVSASKSALVGASLLLAVAAVLAAAAVTMARAASADETWRPVTATVEEVSTGPGRWYGDETGIVHVRYRYDVDGRSYSATRYTRDDEDERFKNVRDEWLAEYLRNLRESPTITVYVDPEDPAQSFREPRARHGMYLLAGFAGLLLCVAVLVGASRWSVHRRFMRAVAALPE